MLNNRTRTTTFLTFVLIGFRLLKVLSTKEAWQAVVSHLHMTILHGYARDSILINYPLSSFAT